MFCLIPYRTMVHSLISRKSVSINSSSIRLFIIRSEVKGLSIIGRRFSNYSRSDSSDRRDLSQGGSKSWMNELVKLQRISEVITESKLENNLIRHRRGSGGGSSDGEDEVLIYSTNLPKNWLRTADGMLASTLGIVAASGYLAQHFRHYGSIPVWPNSDCDWSGIRYERLDESIRFLISVGLISLSSFRALKVFNKLSLFESPSY
ncbi:expressed protein [Phakopsora pachyrhizi]|uniref:Expressed protein n=1 Tax=Phakopsora pachyrhizi TaxID=170000 RepID=A0AAV0B474_PHAPC|nr:expressed protein [Phakopsora pachyrhizi]